jgi:hypothetical protein
MSIKATPYFKLYLKDAKNPATPPLGFDFLSFGRSSGTFGEPSSFVSDFFFILFRTIEIMSSTMPSSYPPDEAL